MIGLIALAWLGVGLVGLTALVWLSRHVELSRAVRTDPPLTPDTFGPPANGTASGKPAEGPAQQPQTDWPMISVLVAAKDEEAVIERCLRSMLEQDYPNYEVIVIDDRSGDRTGLIADALAAENPKLRALHVTEVKEGWFGKNNAMRVGVEAARGDWLCFIDADCEQTSRATLRQAFQFARRHDARFLSVLPTLLARGFWEQVLQPVCGGIMVFWFKPAKVNDPTRPTAYANGAFMLIEKEAYWQIGGHEPVKAEVNEDIHMARRAKEAGVRLRVVQNRGLYRTRMYEGLKATWRGWSRIFYGSFVRRRRLVISLAVMFVMGVLPYVSLGGGLIGLASGGSALAWAALFCGGISVLVQQSVLLRFYPLTGIGRRFTVSYVVGAVIAIAIMVNAMGKVGGARITWRGTTYAGKRRVG